ncbi:hypothetical protein K438DRAFT_183802 [Mycena galopus ATCC 62051]|nr:hypothetical protein K438DRAFT_183802 [Mycena galopus ATCC 62051]
MDMAAICGLVLLPAQIPSARAVIFARARETSGPSLGACAREAGNSAPPGRLHADVFFLPAHCPCRRGLVEPSSAWSWTVEVVGATQGLDSMQLSLSLCTPEISRRSHPSAVLTFSRQELRYTQYCAPSIAPPKDG